jgi:threonine 3-dehydrogenase
MAEPRRDAIDMVMRDLPTLGPGEALVKIRFAGVCGTDLHIIGWNDWAARSYKPPFALGHEFCGEIVDIRGGGHFQIGDRVSGETHLACGHCDQCRRGRGHTCDNLTTFSHLDRGAFADYSVVPVKLLHKVPDGISDRIGAILEPLGISVRCAREAGSEGKDVLISGCGPIGLMTIAAARSFGAQRIIAVDPVSARRDFALQMGADIALDPAGADVVVAVHNATDSRGADVCIETSGAAQAVLAGLKAINRGGTMVMAGLSPQDIPIDITGQIVLREVTLRGVYGRMLDQTWVDTERALLSTLNVDAVITHTFPLEEYAAAIACARGAEAGKVLLEP